MKAILEQLAQSPYLSSFSYSKLEHIEATPENGDVKVWENLNRPFLWAELESEGDFVLYRDYSRGYLAVFKNGVLLGVGEDEIYTDEVIVLSKGYYGLKTSFFVPYYKG